MTDRPPISLEAPLGLERKSKPLVLIIDDLPENLQVLAGYLSELGCDVMPTDNGQRALSILENCQPDLILLDIVMPVMDGFAVCENLKANPRTAEIPVIFLSARIEAEDVVRGLGLGAVDYVTKPFNPAELKARVRTHLELKTSRDLLLAYNQQLQGLTEQLRRMNDDKNRLLGYVSHDIRGAFGNVISVSELLANGEVKSSEQASELLRDLGMEAEHMVALAENLLNTDAIERDEVHLQKQSVSTRQLMDFAEQSHRLGARARNLRVEIRGEERFVAGDLTACRQILTNLLSNAVKYSPIGGLIIMETAVSADGWVSLSIQDEGPGISAEAQARLFRPFARSVANQDYREHLVGLGLSIVKQMTEAMGGRVECESALGKGSRFSFSLPEAD